VRDTALRWEHGDMSNPVELEQSQVDAGEDVFGVEDRPWVTIVWNDPVNLMSYVTYVFQKLFGYSRERATTLMLDVHHKGRAAVSRGSREKVEGDVAKLHAAGLWATMQRDA
jgi:ATP-dependent Clp protease adaptor protein ClpS